MPAYQSQLRNQPDMAQRQTLSQYLKNNDQRNSRSNSPYQQEQFYQQNASGAKL